MDYWKKNMTPVTHNITGDIIYPPVLCYVTRITCYVTVLCQYKLRVSVMGVLCQVLCDMARQGVMSLVKGGINEANSEAYMQMWRGSHGKA